MDAIQLIQTITGIAVAVAFVIGTALACAIAGGNRRLDDEEDEGISAIELHNLMTDEHKDC